MAQLTCKNLTLGYDNRAIQEDLNFSMMQVITSVSSVKTVPVSLL